MMARHLVSGLMILTALTFSAAAKPQITTKDLPGAVVGTPYNQTIAVNGSQAPNRWSIWAGALPPGLTLGTSSGAITGTPTATGTFNFTVRVIDQKGDDDMQALSIVVTAPPLGITTGSLPNGVVGASYSQTLAATGGSGGYSWSRTGGSLPPGLSLSGAGAITGTPTASGASNFTVRVTDSGGRTANKDFVLTIDQPSLSITTASLPNGRAGDAYPTQTLQAAGGSGGNTWSVSAGSLPPGLNLSAAGAIAGTPTAAGTSNFTVRVADNGGRTATRALTITVEAPSLTISTNNVAAGTVGEPYSFTLAASGGRTPYTWRIADGALPDRLSLNAASAVISGTPAAAGTFNFSVEVTDAAGSKTTRAQTLVVNLPSVTTLRVSGVPATLGPMQQPQVDLVIANPYPAAITGRLNLAFVPAPGMPDDPAVQFSTGGRSATFTIAANDTRAAFSAARLLIQSGSVAGTIQFTIEALRTGDSTLPAPSSPIGTAVVPPAAAVIRGVQLRRTSGGFELVVTGATTTRELSRMLVRFRPPAGAALQTSEVTIELTDAARTWFQNAVSAQYGGLFTVTTPFSFVGGASTIDSVGVVLANSAGSSLEASGQY